jgi:hypothetical protein
MRDYQRFEAEAIRRAKFEMAVELVVLVAIIGGLCLLAWRGWL